MSQPGYVDRQSPVALHVQCTEVLLSRIRSGQYPGGTNVPSETELSRELGLSRTTVRLAIAGLVQRGLLMRVQGKGTFVTSNVANMHLQRCLSFSQDMRSRGLEPSSRLLFAGLVDAPSAVLEALQSDNPVFRVDRLRLANGAVMGKHESCLPRELQFPSEMLADDASLYAVLGRVHHVEMVAAYEELEASLATPEEASLLEIEPGSAIFRIERVAFDAEGRPRELNKMHYRANRFKYYFFLRQGR